MKNPKTPAKSPETPPESKAQRLAEYNTQSHTRNFLIQDKRELIVDEEARTVEIAFSSEYAVERWFGYEILSHSAGAVDLSRLKSGGAFLMDHNTRDQVGVVLSVRVDDDRVGRAVIKFSRSQRGEEVYRDIIDGIRTNISVGYFIEEMKLEEERDGDDYYRVTRWLPYEISCVSVPADPSVGAGRSLEIDESERSTTPDAEDELSEAEAIADLSNDAEESNELETADTSERGETSATPQERQQGNIPPMTTKVTDNVDPIAAEQKRVDEILALGEQYGVNDLARACIRDKSTVEQMTRKILEARGFDAKPAEGTTDLGLEDKEVRNYSVVRLLNALANPDDAAARSAAGFELEVSAAAAQKMGKSARGAIVPAEILTRAHTVGSAEDGGALVANELQSGSFIDILQNRMAIMDAGATLLTGLEGNIAIPRQTEGAASFWLAENGQPTGSSAKFDQIALTPKTVGAFTEISRKTLQQTSIGMESFVLRELARVLGLAIDKGALMGAGGIEPLGILNTTGIGAVAMGTNGDFIDWEAIVALETAVADENADVNAMRYLMNSRLRGACKTTERFAGTGKTIWEDGNTVNGTATTVSNQVPKDGTKGTGTDLSTMLYGNFADLIIGMWGGLDLQVNPYSLDTSGAVRVTAFQDVDTNVRHPESFAAIRDIKVK